jgi:hypothetical protein
VRAGALRLGLPQLLTSFTAQILLGLGTCVFSANVSCLLEAILVMCRSRIYWHDDSYFLFIWSSIGVVCGQTQASAKGNEAQSVVVTFWRWLTRTLFCLSYGRGL